MSEQRVQNDGRNALAGLCLNFRANVGQAWTGSDFIKLPNGNLLIVDPRPFSSGLPPGFADTFGLTPEVVTPEMVGRTVGIFHAIEYKSLKGKARERQENFLSAIRANGGRAGVARCAADAVRIALGRPE